MKPAVICRNLMKRFNGLVAVDGIDLEVLEGEFLCLLGPSGCGKTTLLRLIAGLEVPDKGTIMLGDHLVAGPGVHVPPERRRVGMVFQDFALFPHLNVGRNVGFGLRGERHPRSRIRELLELVGLRDHESRFPFELSGGQQQRVALARALAHNPRIIALDEPFSNLDAALRKKLREEVRGILKNTRSTVVFVTHDQEEALSLADRVAVMREGKFLQVDSPRTVYERPVSGEVARLVGEVNFLPGEVKGCRAECELGSFPLRPNPEASAGPVRVQLGFRPESLSLTPDPRGPGLVVRVAYLGRDQLVTVRLDSGREITARLSAQLEVEPGQRVAVTSGIEPLLFRYL